MNIEKTLISVIIALGIAGSAALAAGGRMAHPEAVPAVPTMETDDGVGASLISAHAFDSHYQFFGT